MMGIKISLELIVYGVKLVSPLLNIGGFLIAAYYA